MNKTYDEMIKAAVEYLYTGKNMDDFDKGELSGVAFAIAYMFGKSKVEVKNDIRNDTH